MIVRLLLLWQNPWHKQFKIGKIYFGSWLRKFQFIVDGTIVSGSVVRNIFIIDGHAEWVSYLIVARKQRVTGRVPGQTYTSNACPQKPTSSSYTQLSTVPLLPTSLFKFWIHQWIKSLIRSEPPGYNHVWKYLTTTQRHALLISQLPLSLVKLTFNSWLTILVVK
jgi:hypothetical protein